MKGSTLLPAVGLSLNDLRALKGRPATRRRPRCRSCRPAMKASPPSRTVPLPRGDRTAASGRSDADASQTAALDAAIGKLEATASGHSPTAPVTGADRGTAVTAGSPTISDAAAASALNASLAKQTDAFGEPLSLQGHDAALRLGERLRWLTESGVQEARMQLHPRELAVSTSASASKGRGLGLVRGRSPRCPRCARSHLAAAARRLASEGLQLTQTSVGSQSQQQGTAQQQASADQGERHSSAGGSRLGESSGREIGAVTTGAATVIRQARGLVDRYADCADFVPENKI